MLIVLTILTCVSVTTTVTLLFLFWGTMRNVGLLHWRVEQLEATSPTRDRRSGLKVGQSAPQFELPDANGDFRSLDEFLERDLLLVFVQAGCGPCDRIVPELNRLESAGTINVVAINHAQPDAARLWAEHHSVTFPVLVQDGYDVSKEFKVFATPFAFLIGADGKVRSKGSVSSPQFLKYVLSGAAARDQSESTADADNTNSQVLTGSPA